MGGLPLLACLLALALAADPVVTRGADSWIEGQVDVAAPAEQVFAVVGDPVAMSRLDGTTRVEVVPDGECSRVTTFVEHPLAKAVYETRACPDGPMAVRQTLVGGAMKAFESRWSVEATDMGARVRCRVRSIPDLWIPQAVVDRSAQKSTHKVLEQLRDQLEAAARP